MLIAMNRFQVKKGSEKDFEEVWLSRDTHLAQVTRICRVSFPKGTRAQGLQALFLAFGLAEQG